MPLPANSMENTGNATSVLRLPIAPMPSRGRNLSPQSREPVRTGIYPFSFDRQTANLNWGWYKVPGLHGVLLPVLAVVIGL